MHIPQSWVMLCMADVREVLEANDKSKFHRQIKRAGVWDKNKMNVSDVWIGLDCAVFYVPANTV